MQQAVLPEPAERARAIAVFSFTGAGWDPVAALAAGYRTAFGVAAALVTVALLVAVVTLRRRWRYAGPWPSRPGEATGPSRSPGRRVRAGGRR